MCQGEKRRRFIGVVSFIIKATIWAYLSMFTKQPPFVRIKAVSKPQTAIGSIQLGSLFLTAFTIFDTG